MANAEPKHLTWEYYTVSRGIPKLCSHTWPEPVTIETARKALKINVKLHTTGVRLPKD